jgi:hypothetical protein
MGAMSTLKGAGFRSLRRRLNDTLIGRASFSDAEPCTP